MGLGYAYDGFLVTQESYTGPISGTVDLTYDNNFRVTSRSVNGADTVNFSFDNDGLLTGAGAIGIGRYAQNGLISGTTLGSAASTITYNTFGEVDSYDASYGATSLFTTSYTRDKLGRITQLTETVEGGSPDTYVYTYDTAGRLEDVTKNGASVGNYTYGTNSNRTGYTGALGSFSGTYDDQDRLTQYGTTTYAYTDNGELQGKTEAGIGTTTYGYDVLGNLMSVTLPDTTQIDYVIDGRNRRIGKKVNGALTQGFIYGGQLNPIAELDGSGSVVSRFVYGTRANVPDYMVKGGVTYRIISDHLGSPRLVVDTTTGAIVQRMDYDEFGNVTQDTNAGFQPFGFAGGLYDRHTKLTRFGARDYDAETGRWTAKDPIKFAGGDVNLYGYVLGDPINYIDPSGKVGPLVIPAVIIAAAIKAGEVTIAVLGGYLLGDLISDLILKEKEDESSGESGGQSCPIPGAKPGRPTQGKTKQYDKPGDIDTANEDFDALNPSDVRDYPGSTRAGTLPDGRTIVVYPDSSDGRPTVEIQRGRGRIKVRYGDR